MNATGLGRALMAVGCVLAAGTSALAKGPTVEDALKLAPIQKDVDYDRPTAAEAAKCEIKAEKIGDKPGWVVRSGAGQILRCFVDTNNNNVVDQWSYFKDGIEVYRDIDTNFNGKADQCRWLNSAGTRWGIDKNEDGQIDAWLVISAEEVTAELVAAFAERDAKRRVERFERLLLTPAELKSLGLGKAQADKLIALLKGSTKRFEELAATQSIITADTKWAYFGGSRPGVVPAGTDDCKTDLVVYENVAVMVESGEKPQQIPVGTLIKVQDRWRLVDAPPAITDVSDVALHGLFYDSAPAKADQVAAASGGPSEAEQKAMDELQKIDAELAAAPPERQAELNARRAQMLRQLADDASKPEDRMQWIHQLADTVGAAVQANAYPEGVGLLKELVAKLRQDREDAELAAYVEYRLILAEYGLAVQDPQGNQPEIQKEWLEQLEAFVKAHPDSPDAVDAMQQLGMAEEFAGADAKALAWYKQIAAAAGPTTPTRARAEGAIRRLECVGKPIVVKGNQFGGGAVDLASATYKGKVVLVHYWSSDFQGCVADLPQLKEMLEKYGNAGFAIIGVSLDAEPKKLQAFLQETRVPWPQIYEEGGLDSRLATEMGILTLPTMLLVDRQGKVINRSVHAGTLEGELKALLKPEVANKKK